MTTRLLVRVGHVIWTDQHVNDPRRVGAFVEDGAIALGGNGLAA